MSLVDVPSDCRRKTTDHYGSYGEDFEEDEEELEADVDLHRSSLHYDWQEGMNRGGILSYMYDPRNQTMQDMFFNLYGSEGYPCYNEIGYLKGYSARKSIWPYGPIRNPDGGLVPIYTLPRYPDNQNPLLPRSLMKRLGKILFTSIGYIAQRMKDCCVFSIKKKKLLLIE